MIRTGDTVPDVELRSDEGTPLALTDLFGRDVVVFLLGELFTPTGERLLRVLAENADRFLSLEFSPIAVSGEHVAELAKYHKQNDVPFLLLSDVSYKLHNRLRGEDGGGISVWIISEEGRVVDAVPVLPPTEMVNVVLERINRYRKGYQTGEDES